MPYSGSSYDLQMNGYLEVSFTDHDVSEESVRYACSEYLKRGATKFLPTLITAPPEVYERNFAMLAALMDEDEYKDGMPGFHLEGPFLSPEPGAVGAHNPDYILAPDADSLKQYNEWANGKIKLLTIAACRDGADTLCKAAVDMGITVSLGHQLATYDDLSRLADAGATLLTHLGNGMPNQVPRHDNPLVNGLIHPGLMPMIIADGHHLPKHLVEGIIRTRGAEGLIVVSDTSSLAGMPPGEYYAMGNRCVIEEDGYLHNPDKQCLVGSSMSLQQCADFLSDSCGINDADIEVMVNTNPGRVCPA